VVIKIMHNNYSKRAKLIGIKLSKNKEFYIWSFKENDKNDFVGFTSTKAYYGSKTHMWYSLMVGYFLPESYTINFENIIGKDCIIIIDNKKIVRNIVPIKVNNSSTTKDSNLKSNNPDESLFN